MPWRRGDRIRRPSSRRDAKKKTIGIPFSEALTPATRPAALPTGASFAPLTSTRSKCIRSETTPISLFQYTKCLLPSAIREVKSAAGFASRADQKRTLQARERELANLEARRRSLAALLAADERQYKAELDALTETPEQARARLMAKAQGLKDARENARAALAQEKLTQRMRFVPPFV